MKVYRYLILKALDSAIRSWEAENKGAVLYPAWVGAMKDLVKHIEAGGDITFRD